jgi:GTP-binding protein Era
MTEQDSSPEGFRAGYAAIIGEPNVGTSTLLNGLLGQKISIVTPKPQTTRHKILGILSGEGHQIIFLDTPGLITPKYALHEAMMRAASLAMDDADLLILMIDGSRSRLPDDATMAALLGQLRQRQKPVYLVINKVDLVNKDSLLPLIGQYAKSFSFREIIPLSALTRRGTETLVEIMVRDLPLHPPYYPLDIISEAHQRFFVAEIVREKIFLKCREEIPYSASVDIVEFKEREGGKWFISADVYVEKPSQKGILIGKKGAMLRAVGALARKDIERFLDHPVFLELHVKVRENWRQDEEWLHRLGYTS